jgi:hypothetical protein
VHKLIFVFSCPYTLSIVFDFDNGGCAGFVCAGWTSFRISGGGGGDVKTRKGNGGEARTRKDTGGGARRAGGGEQGRYTISFLCELNFRAFCIFRVSTYFHASHKILNLVCVEI